MSIVDLVPFIIIAVILIAVAILFTFIPVALWISALAAGAISGDCSHSTSFSYILFLQPQGR